MGKRGKHKRKRSRHSSSDFEETPERITPDPKRDRQPESDTSFEDTEVMETVVESDLGHPGISEGLNAKLTDIISGISSMRIDMNNNFVKQSRQLEAMFDAKLAGLRAELDGKLAAIGDDLRAVQEQVTAMESRDAGAHGGPCPGHEAAAADATELRRRLDTLQAGASGGLREALIVKGLQEAAGESVADLKAQCEQMLARLEVNVSITATQRIGTVERGRKPRLVSMTLASHDHVRQVMRHKRQLKDVQEYSSVYIEPMRPAEVRSLEASIRRLTKEHPTLEYRRGRVQPRDDQQRNGPRLEH